MIREQGTARPILDWFLSEYLVLGLTVALFATVAPLAPGFATTASLLNILSYMSPLLVVAIGMTLVMITGGIDLSVTSIIALTSVLGAKLMSSDGHGAPVFAGVLLMLFVGVLLGAANGAMVTLLRLPSFIVTLASMMLLSGIAIWITQSKNIYHLPSGLLFLGQRLTAALAITVAVGLTADLILRRTVYGRWLYAVGQNATAAHISGVPVATITFSAYVASGFCAALASIMLTARLETGSPVLGHEILLDIIGATVVGGTSLFGGKGKIAWTCFGVLFLTVLDNALNLMNLSQFAITITKGLVILIAAVLDSTRRRYTSQAA